MLAGLIGGRTMHVSNPQGELLRDLPAMMQQAEDAVCEGCGSSFSPNRRDQRCCSATCRAKAHRLRSRKRTLSAAVPSPWQTYALPANAAVSGHPKAEPRSTLRPCTRPGFPPGLFEGADGEGLPIFFNDIGPLIRVWGTAQPSDLQLRNMRLETTELAFPGGVFLRRLDDTRADGSGR
jgi:hypothetical protein